MCFYIYSPTVNLQVEYASEFIKLDKNGISEVIVDLLITNKSETPIYYLKFLYPNRFYEITKKKTIKRTGDWDNVTETFLEDHKFNWVYNLPGSAVKKKPSVSSPFVIPEWGTYFEIAQADPRDTLKEIYYQGVIGGGIDLNLEKDIDYVEANILRTYNLTLFRCSLKQPLEKNVPRWMRFTFKGECSIYNREGSSVMSFIKKCTNLLHYEYQIFGPYDVRDRLKTYLATTRQYCDDGKCSSDYRRGAIDLYSYFITEGLIPEAGKTSTAETIIVHWYIHVYPGKMGRITDIIQNGEIQTAGLMPNYIGMDPKNKLKVYEWKTGFADNKEPEFKFSVFFQAKPANLIYPLIPWIALFLAIGFNFYKIKQFLKSLLSIVF